MSENIGICPQFPAIRVRKVSPLSTLSLPFIRCMVTVARYFGMNRCFTPAMKYASQLRFFLRRGLVSSIMSASNPIPEMIRNAWPWSSFGLSSMVTRPTSTCRDPCEVATLNAASTSFTGMPMLRAKRFPVPIGMIPMAWPCPLTALATVLTVPSPPTATTTFAPLDNASSAHARPSLSSCVSIISYVNFR